MVDIGTLIFLEQYSWYGLETCPGSVPGPLWAAWAANWMWVARILPFMAFVPLLFPTGRLPSPRWLDRRFNRRRYDAVRTIDGFTARLRDEIDLDALTAHLLDVVDETMEPARISLWLQGRELTGEPVR